MIVIFEDTRQKKDKHKNIQKQCDALNILLEPKKLDVGDYKIKGLKNIVIDTKQDIYELASDFFSKKEVVRFQKQCKRAKQENVTLYILTEQPMTKEKLLNWKSWKHKDGTPITKVNGKQIYHKMQIYSLAFGVKWRFCSKKETVKKMLNLFGVKNE